MYQQKHICLHDNIFLKSATNTKFCLQPAMLVYKTQIVEHLSAYSKPRAGIMSIIRGNIGSAQSAGYWLLGALDWSN